MAVLTNIQTWITLIEHLLPDPHDLTQLSEWLDQAEGLTDGLDLDEQYELVEKILRAYEHNYRMLFTHKSKQTSHLQPSREILDELCGRHQIAQRSEEWYAQMSDIVSASEVWQLFGTPRLRAQMVMTKAFPQPRPMQPLAVPTNQLTPFQWGIRFEPVVKQIYCFHNPGVELRELGRLRSRLHPKCQASPDGLVYHDAANVRTGRLIEIKCPVTRPPNGVVPQEYYHQVQMQLHVTELHECDFVEAVFCSPYSKPLDRCGPGMCCGEIALIEDWSGEVPIYYYEYSPVNPPADWTKSLSLHDQQQIVEIVPWSLFAWYEQMIRRSEAWWEMANSQFGPFWEDVAKARRGEFVMPEPKYKSRKTATPLASTSESAAASTGDDVCQIVFSETDLSTPSLEIDVSSSTPSASPTLTPLTPLPTPLSTPLLSPMPTPTSASDIKVVHITYS